MILLNQRKTVHFIGIGGVGMSGLAEFLHAAGYTVSGSDRQSSAITKRLESLGMKIQHDHNPMLVRDAHLVVYSSAIKDDNPERTYARDNKIPVMRRAEMLGELMRMKFSIAVAGTHGKTTTTSLIGQIFSDAGWTPTVIVGGILRRYNTNAIAGKGDILVAEADEYDRSFLKMYPSLAVVTNIEEDHLDCYSGIEDIKAAFMQFANLVPFYGALVACSDEPHVRELLAGYAKPAVTYGVAQEADYTARDISFTGGKTAFSVYKKTQKIGALELTIPGLHNVKNALAACAVATELGVDFAAIAKSLLGFGGIKRRFEIIGQKAGVTVIDDYAHHPSEIAATLSAARSAGYRRVMAVFQPHLYTRTRDFLDTFAQALCAADEFVVTAIYKSREEPIAGVNSLAIVEKAKKLGHAHALYIEKKADIAGTFAPLCRAGDAVVVMGAGDINEICKDLLAGIRDA
jgi:UDP-N-acetylmuramate--alanine ligase